MSEREFEEVTKRIRKMERGLYIDKNEAGVSEL